MADKIKVIEKSDLERMISGIMLIENDLEQRIEKGGAEEIVSLFRDVKANAEKLREDLDKFKSYRTVTMQGYF